MSPIYDDIRDAIEANDKTRYRIAKETGIGESQLSLFMAGKKGLSVEALETLADCLGLEITTRRIRKKTNRKDQK
jgi:transcriptional regulator with XRE-family HTH domain